MLRLLPCPLVLFLATACATTGNSGQGQEPERQALTVDMTGLVYTQSVNIVAQCDIGSALQVFRDIQNGQTLRLRPCIGPTRLAIMVGRFGESVELPVQVFYPERRYTLYVRNPLYQSYIMHVR